MTAKKEKEKISSSPYQLFSMRLVFVLVCIACLGCAFTPKIKVPLVAKEATNPVLQEERSKPLCVADDDCNSQQGCYDGKCAKLDKKKPKTRKTGRKIQFAKDFKVNARENGDSPNFNAADKTNIAHNKFKLVGFVAGSDDEIEEELDAEVIAEARIALRIVNEMAHGDRVGVSDTEDGKSLRGVPTHFERPSSLVQTESDSAVPQYSVPGYWEQITATTQSPWNRMGRLSMGCTATYVGTRVLVTAAHCLYDKDAKEWQSQTTSYFCPGQSGSSTPYSCWYTEKFLVSYDWVHNAGTGWTPWYDWGVVILPASSTRPNTGYFGFTYYSTASWDAGFTLNIAGYPASKGKQLWYDSCMPDGSATDNSFKHMCDTEGGNSGSAAYRLIDGTKRYVVATHAGGSTTVNSGYKFTKDHFDRLISYRSAYP